jgi:hypothetical protein
VIHDVGPGNRRNPTRQCDHRVPPVYRVKTKLMSKSQTQFGGSTDTGASAQSPLRTPAAMSGKQADLLEHRRLILIDAFMRELTLAKAHNHNRRNVDVAMSWGNSGEHPRHLFSMRKEKIISSIGVRNSWNAMPTYRSLSDVYSR